MILFPVNLCTPFSPPSLSNHCHGSKLMYANNVQFLLIQTKKKNMKTEKREIYLISRNDWCGRRRWLLLQYDVLDVKIDLLLTWWWHWLQAETFEGLQFTFSVVHLSILEVYIFWREYALWKRHVLNTLVDCGNDNLG